MSSSIKSVTGGGRILGHVRASAMAETRPATKSVHGKAMASPSITTFMLEGVTYMMCYRRLVNTRAIHAQTLTSVVG